MSHMRFKITHVFQKKLKVEKYKKLSKILKAKAKANLDAMRVGEFRVTGLRYEILSESKNVFFPPPWRVPLNMRDKHKDNNSQLRRV